MIAKTLDSGPGSPVFEIAEEEPPLLASNMADFQIFTDSHAKSILATMNNLRKINTLCDVTLDVQGQKFPAHRIVLAACSDYFCAMFTNEVSPSSSSATCATRETACCVADRPSL